VLHCAGPAAAPDFAAGAVRLAGVADVAVAAAA